MRTSSEGLRLIEEFEGFRPTLYDDLAGDCTIGYGTLVHLGPRNGELREWPYLDGINRAEAEQLLQAHVQQIEGSLERLVKVALNQAQFDALVAFIYNVGLGTFSRSTLLKKLNAGEYAAVPSELMRYVYAGNKPAAGLVARRTREAELWRSGEGAPAAMMARGPLDSARPARD